MKHGDTQQSPGAPASSEAISRAPDDSGQAEAAESTPVSPPVDPELERALADALRAPASAPSGVMVDGKYVVMSLLGEGGMSRVFEAKNHMTGRRVALKWLHGRPGSPGIDPHRLIQEARATARIEHPNVVQVFDLGFMGGQPYLVMELLRGDALDGYLERNGPLSPRHASFLLEPVLDAAHAFHRAGVVHRDLKPANLFMVQDGVNPPYLKVLDFGVASLIPNYGEGEESLSLTLPGMALGTPFYMAPEQLRREKASPRSDVFALGCILYEMCTGERPFPAKDFAGLLELLQSESPADRRERLRGTLPALADVLARALAHDPKDRFQTAEEFQEALIGTSFDEASSKVGATLEPSQPTLSQLGRVDVSDTPESAESGVREPTSGHAVVASPRRLPRAIVWAAVAAALVLGGSSLQRVFSPRVLHDPGASAPPADPTTETRALLRDPAQPTVNAETSAPVPVAPSAKPAGEVPGRLARTTESPPRAAKKLMENAAQAASRESKAPNAGSVEMDEEDF